MIFLIVKERLSLVKEKTLLMNEFNIVLKVISMFSENRTLMSCLISEAFKDTAGVILDFIWC